MSMTSAELHAVTIGGPGWGRKGYRPEEVDAFLARAAEALDALAADRTPSLTADEVHDVVFAKAGWGRGRGYDEDQVDDLLDAVESALRGDPAPSRGAELNGRPLEP
jgi:DivIVA domain-containing protein